MNKETFLEEKFREEYGEKLGSKSRLLNVLSNLIMGDNINVVEDSIRFYDDKISSITNVNKEVILCENPCILFYQKNIKY